MPSKTLNLRELEGGLEGYAAYGSRFIGGRQVRSFHPPKRRTLTLPSGRLHRQPAQLGHFRGAVMYEIVYNILFTEPVAAGDDETDQNGVSYRDPRPPQNRLRRRYGYALDRLLQSVRFGFWINLLALAARTCSACANDIKIGLKSLHDDPQFLCISPPGWRKSITPL